MKLKFLQAAVAGLILSVSSIANAGIIDIDFTIDGDTYSDPWTISNNSTDGVLLESFVFDLRPIATYCYDTGLVSGCRGSTGPNFSPVSGDIETGFINAIVTNEVGGLDFNDFLQINFFDFGFGDTFSWSLDVDSSASVSVYGNELIGSTVYAQMSDGNVYYGNLETIAGNSDASRFVISHVSDKQLKDIIHDVPEPSTLAIFALGIMGLATRRFKKQ
jgi:hypothetical protein